MAFTQSPMDRMLHQAQWTLLGSYVISISDIPTFSMDDINKIHQLFCTSQPQPTTDIICPCTRMLFVF